MRRHVAAEDPDLADRLALADPLSRYPRPFELPGPPEVAVSEEEARDALERAERVGRLVRDRLWGFLDTA